MNIGATSIFDQIYLDDDDSQDTSDDGDTSMDDSEDDFDPMELDDDTNEALLDNLMASTAQPGKSRGVDPKHHSKIWRISHDDAQRTIDVTTQMSIQTDDPVLSRSYGMNGVTSEIKQQPFQTTRKFWAEYLAQPEEQAMKWPNGYSRQMAELYAKDL